MMAGRVSTASAVACAVLLAGAGLAVAQTNEDGTVASAVPAVARFYDPAIVADAYVPYFDVRGAEPPAAAPPTDGYGRQRYIRPWYGPRPYNSGRWQGDDRGTSDASRSPRFVQPYPQARYRAPYAERPVRYRYGYPPRRYDKFFAGWPRASGWSSSYRPNFRPRSWADDRREYRFADRSGGYAGYRPDEGSDYRSSYRRNDWRARDWRWSWRSY